jgi:hypothetical protein
LTFNTLFSAFLKEIATGPGSPLAFFLAALAGVVAPPIVGNWLGFMLGFCLLCVAVVFWSPTRRPTTASAIGGVKVAASTMLVSFVLGFLSIMTVFAAGLAAFAIMTGSGFDFDAIGNDPEAFGAAMEAYQATPGWQLSLAVFGIAMLILAIGVARAVPVFAGAVEERRIVALEGFNWTRRQGAKILLVAVLGLLPSAFAIASATALSGSIIALVLSALGFLIGVYAMCALSWATYRVLAPVSDRLDGAD